MLAEYDFSDGTLKVRIQSPQIRLLAHTAFLYIISRFSSLFLLFQTPSPPPDLLQALLIFRDLVFT